MNDSKIGTYAKPRCMVCQSYGRVLYDNLSDTYFGAPGLWRLKKCSHSSCGLVWLDPAPNANELWKAYKTYHTHAQKTNRLTWQAKLMRKLCNLVFVPLSWITGMAVQRRRLRYMYLDKVAPGRLLEIGFGGGRFLNRMQKSGWSVEGIDFDAAATERAKNHFGLNVHTAELTSMHYPNGHFDAIVMSHTIEHLSEPDATLVECFRILKPGGRISISTPNVASAAHAMYGSFWRGLEPPRHLQIFSPQGLELILQKTGFSIDCTRTLSSDSAGIYYVSALAKQGSSSVVQSFTRQFEEYRACQQGQAVGQDLLVIACKPA